MMMDTDGLLFHHLLLTPAYTPFNQNTFYAYHPIFLHASALYLALAMILATTNAFHHQLRLGS